MRVAVVHGYYSNRAPSGENVVVDLQIDALRTAGYDVQVFSRRQEEAESEALYPLRAAVRAATGRGFDATSALRDFGPDVVHVHNLFPNFGRSWVREFADRLVATLHNYRPLCPAATLFREGRHCTLCPDRQSAWPALRHACFKDSRVATLPLVAGTRFANDPVLRHSTRLLTLHDEMRSQYAAAGVPAGRMVTVPNFVRHDPEPSSHDAGYWLYVGRLEPEKGIAQLVRDWPAGSRLLIVGAGSAMETLAANAPGSVELLGARTPEEVAALQRAAIGLVFPSLWPEGLPTVYLEALSRGLPVLASAHSIVGRLVAEQGTGLVMGESLDADLRQAERLFPTLQARCDEVFHAHYTPRAWLSRIAEVYADVTAARDLD